MDFNLDEVDLGFVVNPEVGVFPRAAIVQKPLDRSIASTSNGTAYKSGRHEVFQRERKLIFTNRRDYPFVNVVVCERLKFADLFYSLTVVAERDKLPDEITFRFAHVPYVPPQGNKPKPPSMRLSAV